jgi:hypothetical protein
MSETRNGPFVPAGRSPKLGRLKKCEFGQRGDFMRNEREELELWEGPNGLRADSFVIKNDTPAMG